MPPVPPEALAGVPAVDVLRERSAELGAIERAVDVAVAGDGRLLVFEGPAGIGKSSLLQTVRDRAEAAGMQTLAARGGELERRFGFGVARQLFEAAVRDGRSAPRLLAPGARRRPPKYARYERGRRRTPDTTMHPAAGDRTNESRH